MNVINLALIQKLLSGLGIALETAEGWIKDYETAHPDTAGLVEAFWQWVASHVSDANISAALHGAFADLATLVQTGKGPISADNDPTSLA